MSKTLLFLTLLSLACSSRKEVPISGNKSHYTLTVDDKNIRHFAVEGIVALPTDTLVMSQIMQGNLAGGYAEFVHDLKVFDEKGVEVAINTIGKSTWHLQIKTPATVRLQYAVNIDHDKIDWDVSSAFGRGYVLENTVFFVGRVMFITPTTLPEPIEIRFKLPDGWDVGSCLEPSNENPGSFNAVSLERLLNNGFLIGRLAKKEIQIGKLQIEIAGPKSMREGIDHFYHALDPIVKSYESQMGGTPTGKLAIMASTSTSHVAGGEAFPNSISLMLYSAPDNSNKSYWGYQLAHEIYHLWNGHSIRAANQEEVEWFVEGFTQYMSRLTTRTTGLMPEDEFEYEMSRAKDSYLSESGNMSMKEAGREKGRNYRLIYDGGMVIASSLDREIRNSTKTKSLQDFMRAMFEKFGVKGKTYTYDDIVTTATEIAGKDMSSFFQDYVAGTKVIEID